MTRTLQKRPYGLCVCVHVWMCVCECVPEQKAGPSHHAEL